MEKAYFDSGYEITAMLRVLFTSDFFKAENARFAKIKSPAEMVASLMRTTGEHRGEFKPGLFEISQEPKYMGMDLMNPPTVEGWHTGHEWIDSGTLVERINFAAVYLGRTDLPGVQDMVSRLRRAASACPLRRLWMGALTCSGVSISPVTPGASWWRMPSRAARCATHCGRARASLPAAAARCFRCSRRRQNSSSANVRAFTTEE